jgi:hypothetical protein
VIVKHSNGASEPVCVFVGTSPGGEDAEACMVAEYGVRERASAPVEITWLRLSRDPASPCAGWRTERWGTPWTGLRWAVPEICGWRGRAVYLDCPQVVLGDVAALAAASIPDGAFVLARRAGSSLRTGCMVFDCARAKKWLPSLDKLRADVGAHQAVGALLAGHQHLVGPLPAGWGLVDEEFSSDPDAAAGSVHCANPHVQPHARYAVPRLRRAGREHWFAEMRLPHYCPRLVELFDAEYAAALVAGRTVAQYVPEEPWGPCAIRGVERVSAGRTA